MTENRMGSCEVDDDVDEGEARGGQGRGVWVVGSAQHSDFVTALAGDFRYQGAGFAAA